MKRKYVIDERVSCIKYSDAIQKQPRCRRVPFMVSCVPTCDEWSSSFPISRPSLPCISFLARCKIRFTQNPRVKQLPFHEATSISGRAKKSQHLGIELNAQTDPSLHVYVLESS